MLLHLFTVHDAKVEAYMAPFFMRSKGEAIRSMSDTAQDETHIFNKHPEDYYLFHVGEFDDTTGIFLPNATPEPLVSALDLIKRPDNLHSIKDS